TAFAKALEEHFPTTWIRCNQDDLGNRRAVEQLARRSLAQGLSVCIDRQNFDHRQRAHWIHIAHEFPGTKIAVLVFDTPYSASIMLPPHLICTGHATIKSSELALELLARFQTAFVPPGNDEGHERVLYVQPKDLHVRPEDIDSPVYSQEDVKVVLQHLEDSPRIDPRPYIPPAREMGLFRDRQRCGSWPEGRGDKTWSDSKPYCR
ncbi:hypothetical protein FISHEDRAFT_34462, partial [Fistulina hepatica ATCC 64428]